MPANKKMKENMFDKFLIVKRLLRGVVLKYSLLYIFAGISALLEVVSIGLLIPLIYFVTKTEMGGSKIAEFIEKMANTIGIELNIESVCLFLVAVFIGKNVLRFFVEFGNAKIANKIRGRWMQNLFIKYMDSNYAFFVHKKQGTLIYNLFELTNECVSGLRQLVTIFMCGASSIIVLFGLFVLSWQVTLGSIIFVVLGHLLINKPLVRKSLKLGKGRLAIYHTVNNISAESFKGIREIKTYSAEQSTADYYQQAVERMAQLRINLNFYQLLPMIFPEIMLITFLSFSLIILNRIPGVQLHMLMPFIGTYAYASFRLFVNGGSLVKNMTAFSSHWPSVEYLYETLQSNEYPEVSQGKLEVPDSGENLILDTVSFSYVQGQPVISNLSTTFQKGSFTAVVGGSGTGKSTLADLILRLYEPQRGSITYSGMEIKEYSLKSWRQIIGFVSQDTFLFHGTIKENIAFGLQDLVSDEVVIEVAKKANAHDFIMQTRNGYETIVGERGTRFSGGQRQRIAIARALIRNPRILVFDEATSALDTKSEMMVMDTIEKIKRSVILVVIAHRLSTVVNADEILVLKEGEIVEKGCHCELLSRKGEYWQLYQKQ